MARLITAVALGCRWLPNRCRWNTANHVISERVLLILRCGKRVEETAAQVLTALTTGIEFGNIVLGGLGQVVAAHVLHVRLINDVCLERLLAGALRAIIAYEHNLHILLVWMWVALARRVGVGVSTDFDLFDTGMSADFGRLLVLEAASTNGIANSCALPDHLIVYVLIWALI